MQRVKKDVRLRNKMQGVVEESIEEECLKNKLFGF